MRQFTYLLMPLMLGVLAAIPLIFLMPKLKSQIAALSGGATKDVAEVSAPAGSVVDSDNLEYPARMKLQNAEGESLQVVLLSRTKSKIQFLRESDRSEHIYSIHKLDPLSRKRVEAYPVTGIKLRESSVAVSALSRDEIYIEQLREEIRKLKNDLDLLKLKENESNRYDISLRKEDLEARIKKIELNIARREQSL